MMLSIWNNCLAIIVIVHHQYCRMIKTHLPALKTSGVSKYNSGWWSSSRSRSKICSKSVECIIGPFTPVRPPRQYPELACLVSKTFNATLYLVCSNRQHFTHLNFPWHYLPTRAARKFVEVTHGVGFPFIKELDSAFLARAAPVPRCITNCQDVSRIGLSYVCYGPKLAAFTRKLLETVPVGLKTVKGMTIQCSR